VFTLNADGVSQKPSEKPGNVVLPPIPVEAELRSSLKQLAAWNSRARFIILTLDENTLHFVLHELRDLNVANVVLLVLARNRSTVKAYTWFPYLSHGQCGKQDLNPVLLDECLMENGAKFVRNTPLYPQKVPSDLHGCSITVSTFPWPPFIIASQEYDGSDKVIYTEGLEIRLVSAIAHNMNLTIHYLPPPANDSKWGGITPEGSWTGLLGDVFYKRADVGFATITATKERLQHLDTTITYWSNSVVWVVPRPKFISGWRNLVGIFKPTMWWIVVAAYLLGSASLCCLARMAVPPREPALYQNPGSCMMTTWAISLETAARVQPRGLVMRIVFICWAVYCMQISTAYKSSLISFLTNPRQEPAISNMEQLEKSGLGFEYTVGLAEYFDDPPDVSMRHIGDSLRFCDNVTACLKKMALTADTAMVSDKAYLAYLIPRMYLDSSGRPLLQTLPEEVLSYYIVMFLSKGNILLDRFNAIINSAVENGFMVKWAKDIYHNRTSGSVSQDSAGGHKLSVWHLGSLFLLLLLGEGLAMLTLIAEMVISKAP
jgi:hypothetical protein